MILTFTALTTTRITLPRSVTCTCTHQVHYMYVFSLPLFPSSPLPPSTTADRSGDALEVVRYAELTRGVPSMVEAHDINVSNPVIILGTIFTDGTPRPRKIIYTHLHTRILLHAHTHTHTHTHTRTHTHAHTHTRTHAHARTHTPHSLKGSTTQLVECACTCRYTSLLFVNVVGPL